VIKITKAGWIYIGLTVLLGVAAVNTGNNLVYLVVSAMLSFMVISSFLARRNLSGLDLEVELPEEVFAGVEFPLKVKLKNGKKLLPSFLLVFSFEGKRQVVPYVDRDGSVEFHLLHTYGERGKKEISGFQVCSVFPFNFFFRCVFYGKKIPVVVYPKPVPCPFPYEEIGRSKNMGSFTVNKTGYGEDLLSIREYTAGDPLKLIHWKASAKTGELKTKELSENTVPPVVIDLDRLSGSREDRISCATYLILQLYRESVPFGLKIGKKFFKPEFSRRQKATLLTELALL